MTDCIDREHAIYIALRTLMPYNSSALKALDVLYEAYQDGQGANWFEGKDDSPLIAAWEGREP